MQKQQAQTIVKETFQNAFDKERFVRFVKELLNHVEPAPFVYRGNLVPDAYEQHISALERIGKYTDGEHEVDILIVKLKKAVSIERARTMQRNFIAWYLNGSRGDKMKDAALVAFVSPDDQDWRFSLVKMEYKFKEGKNKQVKVKEEFTPAKRWSFLVGINENSHTAQSRLVPIVEDDEHNPTLQQLEDAFNIEKVTKEFFEKYRDIFLRVSETLRGIAEKDGQLKKDFADKNVSIADFSKKLLGQIVFLYFLQKKGWFGVPMSKVWGEGDKKFMRTLFQKARSENKNYFNDFLEPLFYEALAKERDDDFYSRFECKIPFLNGGLFDPISNYDWVNTVIELPDDLFSNTNKTKQGDTGDGILDIFDRYNFTVKEDEPLEKEVAVDPEMLGKVFENLLEVKDRKSKGTYYTPREIVHYMCEQSLINYLATELEGKVPKEAIEQLVKYGEAVGENEARVEKEGRETDAYYYKLPESVRDHADEIDDALATIKVCDPAIGSGAFPVGMMSEIVKARSVLSAYLKGSDRTVYNFKRDCIQNSLYGVDIDPGAVEIAKLRLWLSLVVDEDDIKLIKPLPNLDYKIMQGNSLLEDFEGIKLFDEKLVATVDTGKEKQLESLAQKQSALQKEYFDLHSQNMLIPAKQAELNSELKKLQTQIKKLNKPEKATTENAGIFDVYSEAKKKADDLRRLHKEFFEVTQKSKKDNIKKQIEQLEWDLIGTTLKEQGKTSALKKLEEFKRSNIKPFFLWKLNFADVFVGKGGFDVVIGNPPYINIGKIDKNLVEIYKAKFKSAQYGRFDLYVVFIESTLSLLRKNGIQSFIVPDKICYQKYAINIRAIILNTCNILKILNLKGIRVFETALVDNIVYVIQKGNTQNNIVKITNVQEKESLEEIILNVPHSIRQDTLRVFRESMFRLDVDKNDLQILEKIDRKSIFLKEICYVSFGLQPGNLSKFVFNLTENPERKGESKYSQKKFIRGRNVTRYYINYSGDVVLYLPKELHRPAFPELFENEKVVISEISADLKCAYDIDRYYSNEKTVIVIPWKIFETVSLETLKDRDIHLSKEKDSNSRNFSLLFILAILNSTSTNYYFKKLISDGLNVYPDNVRWLPIAKVSTDEQKPFIDLIDQILKITKEEDYFKNAEKQAKVRGLEHQIDGMVYELYGLTEEEIKIVKNNVG